MKILLTLCASLFLITSVSAFSPFGVKIGVNGGNMLNLPEGANNTTKMSFYAGVFTKFDMGRRFSLQPELVYSRQGARLSPMQLFPDESGQLIDLGELNKQIRLNYINIPIVVSYKVWEDLFVSVAPQLGINLNAIDRTKYNDYTATTKLNGIRRCDFSLGVGLGYQIWSKLDVTVRYNLGFTNITKSKSDFNQHNIKNGVLQLGLGFMIFE